MHIPNRFDLQNIIKKYTFQTALICGIFCEMHIPNRFDLRNIVKNQEASKRIILDIMPPKHFTQKSGGLQQVPGVLPVENRIENRTSPPYR